MSDQSLLKKELQNLIATEDTELNYGKILEIASKLSTHDTENVRFSVDGNLVKRLGEQLVAKKTTALSELIKNSYDAEASKVDVIFENTEEPGGTITIIDNGNGMTKKDLINGFMKISTSDKEDTPVSPVYKRARAGRKGIGRFSAQKIGRRLTVVTRTSVSEPYLVIDIDWDEYRSKTNLLTISNRIFESDEEYGFDQGTKLIIADTKEVWSEQNQSTAFKYISSVIRNTPIQLSDGIVDPGFSPTFYTKIPISGELLPISTDKVEFLSEALAHINAKVLESREIEIEIKGIKGLDFNDTYLLSVEEADILKAADFKFNAYYFVFSIKDSRYLHTYVNENGGVKLYRNGFYVAPYGGKFNDWLGLDDSARRRKILPPHANTNFIGGIDITDIDGKLFEETSSREGLIENRQFDVLREVAYDVITSAVSRIAAEQGKKVTASQSGFVKKDKTIEEKLQENQSKLRSTAKKIIDSSEPDTQDLFGNSETGQGAEVKIASNISMELQEGLSAQEEYIKELIDEKNMYRVLSSSGLAIGEFTHEIQLYLNALTLNGKQLRRAVSDNVEAIDSAIKIESNIEMLVSYTDFFTDTIRNNSQRTKEVLELREVLKGFFDAMRPTLERRAYQFITEFDGDDFWTRPMHISEISSVCMNLFTNACKAIARSSSSPGKIRVALSSADDSHIMRFEDNGDGIPKENWGKVFGALFTTEKSIGAYSNESHQMRGMGLGLTISQNIVESFNGEISVIEPSEGYKTCIQVVIPKAKEAEVPVDAY